MRLRKTDKGSSWMNGLAEKQLTEEGKALLALLVRFTGRKPDYKSHLKSSIAMKWVAERGSKASYELAAAIAMAHDAAIEGGYPTPILTLGQGRKSYPIGPRRTGLQHEVSHTVIDGDELSPPVIRHRRVTLPRESRTILTDTYSLRFPTE